MQDRAVKLVRVQEKGQVTLPAEVRRAAEVAAAKDAPILAGAIVADAAFLATFDRQHPLSAADRIHAAFGIIVATPSEMLRRL